MSFTSVVKNEVSKIDAPETEKISELSAIIRNIGTITNTIKITSENASVTRRIFNLIKNLYHITPAITVRRGFNFNKNYHLSKTKLFATKTDSNFILRRKTMADENIVNVEVGGIDASRLRSLVERIERLEEEKKELQSDIRDIYAEAKSAGFDVKALRTVLKLRKMNAADRDEQENWVATLRRALDF